MAAQAIVDQPQHVSSTGDVAVHTETFDISVDALGNDVPKRYYLQWHFLGTAIGCICANNTHILPYILSANAMPAILTDVGPAENAIWISLAFTLAEAVCLLVAGRLSDIFGRRWFVVGACFFCCLGNIICATAKDVNTIIAGMIFCGIGGGVLVSFPMIISELVPNKHRGIWIGSIYSTSIGPYGFGPLIGQSIASMSPNGWRWCFYLGIIMGGVTTLIFFICYYPPDFSLLHVRHSRRQQLKRTDFVGIFLYTAGLILFLMGLSWGGVLYPWKSASVIATTVIGGLVLIAFILYEMHYKGDQILPTHLFKSRGFVPMTILASVGTCVSYSLAILWPQQVNALFPGDATHTGLLSSVQGLTTLAGMFTAGMCIHFLPWHRISLVTSTVLMVTFCGAMVSIRPGETVRGGFFMGITSFSIGIVEVAARALMPLSCPDEDIGAALGVLGSVGFATAAVATAIYVTVLNNKLTTILPREITAAAQRAGLPDSSIPSLLTNYSTNITSVPGINEDMAASVGTAVANSYAKAFISVWYAALAFAILSLISALFTDDYNYLMTDKVARKLQHSSRAKPQDAEESKTSKDEKVENKVEVVQQEHA